MLVQTIFVSDTDSLRAYDASTVNITVLAPGSYSASEF